MPVLIGVMVVPVRVAVFMFVGVIVFVRMRLTGGAVDTR